MTLFMEKWEWGEMWWSLLRKGRGGYQTICKGNKLPVERQKVGQSNCQKEKYQKGKNLKE